MRSSENEKIRKEFDKQVYLLCKEFMISKEEVPKSIPYSHWWWAKLSEFKDPVSNIEMTDKTHRIEDEAEEKVNTIYGNKLEAYNFIEKEMDGYISSRNEKKE